MQDPLLTFISSITIIVIGLIVFTLIWVVTQFLIKRKFKKNKKLPRDAINGLLIFIRFMAGIIILFAFLSIFGIIDPTTVLSFSTIFSTAIGFACALAIGNIVAGFYIMITRPYGIGDYIQITGIEGFVTEIGLNFTKIEDATTHIVYKIPNKVAMNENLIIYETIKPDSGKKVDEKQEDTKITDKIRDVFDIFQDEELIKYVLKTEFELNIDPIDLKRSLDEVCERWIPTFGYKPYPLFDRIHWRITIRIIIASDEMQTIQSSLSEFLDDMWISIYGSEGEVV